MTSYWYRHTQSARGAWPFQNLPQWHPPHHELTCNRSLTSIPSLDVNVSIINGKIITDLHLNDWQTISITLFMPPFIHQTCRFFQFSSQKNLLNRRYQRYIGEWKRRLKDRLNKQHRLGRWQAHQHIRKFSSLIITPLMTSHSFH